MSALSRYGFVLVLTIHAIGNVLLSSVVSASLICALVTYIVGAGFWLRSTSLTSSTIPTICRGGSSNSGPAPLAIVIRSPTGLPFGQNFAAIDLLIKTTGGA